MSRYLSSSGTWWHARVTQGLKCKFPFKLIISSARYVHVEDLSHDAVLCLVTKSEWLAERQTVFPQLIGTANSDLPSAAYEGVHAGPTPALNKFVLHQSVGLSFPSVSAEVAQKLKTNILMCRKLRSAYALQTN